MPLKKGRGGRRGGESERKRERERESPKTTGILEVGGKDWFFRREGGNTLYCTCVDIRERVAEFVTCREYAIQMDSIHPTDRVGPVPVNSVLVA